MLETASQGIAKPRQGAAKPSRRPRLVAPKRLTARAAVRYFNGLVLQFTRELQGNRTAFNTTESELVRQAAAMMLRAKQMQADIVAGTFVDADELIRVTSETRRAVKALNLPAAGSQARKNGLRPLRWR